MAASNNAIGTGALILSANADQMIKGLDKASKVTQDWAAKQARVAEKHRENMQKFLSPFALGFVAGLAGQIAERFKALGASIVESVSHVADFRAEIERAARLSGELAKVTDRGLGRADEWLNAIVDPAARLAAVTKEIAMTEKELAGKKAGVAEAADELKRLGRWTGDGATDAWKLWLGGGLSTSIDAARGKLTDATAAADKFSDRLAGLVEMRNRLADPKNDPGLLGDINRLAAGLKLQVDTFGMTATQAQLFALRARGATDDMLADAQRQAKLLEGLQGDIAARRLSGAFAPGSTEAYSIVAKWQTQNTMPDRGKQQLQALDQIKAVLGAIKQILAGGAELIAV